MNKKIIFLYLLLTISLIVNGQQDSLIKDFRRYVDSCNIELNKEKSLKYSFKLLEIAQQMKSDKHLAYAFLQLSYDYQKLGNYTTALKYALQSIQFYEKLKLTDYSSIAYNNIGSIYMSLENYDLSLQYLNRAAKSHLENGNSSYLGADWTNIGEVYRLQNKIDSAFYYYKKAYDIYMIEKKDSLSIAYSQCNLGLIYYLKNQQNISDSLFNIAFSYLNSINDFYPESIIWLEKAKVELSKNHLNEAKRFAIYSYDLTKKGNYNNKIRDVLLLLSDIEKSMNNYYSAFNYLSEYQIYKDSLANDKVVSSMAEMRAEYEISQKEQEVTYFKKISKARTLIAISTGLGGILVIILAMFLFKLTRRLRFANHQLEDFNEELQQKNDVIHQSLLDKEVLIKEIHHRVKNNLQIISSIIHLQNMRITDNEVRVIFDEMQRRILAISSIHQKLYQSDSVSSINMRDYLTEVVDAIHIAFNSNELNVKYEIGIQQIEMDIDAAVSLGLMVNELATNSYKYAFMPGQNNQFVVKLERTNEEGYRLTVSDNGKGLPESLDLAKANSLGLRMVSLLCRQLKGEIKMYTHQGAKFEIIF